MLDHVGFILKNGWVINMIDEINKKMFGDIEAANAGDGIGKIIDEMHIKVYALEEITSMNDMDLLRFYGDHCGASAVLGRLNQPLSSAQEFALADVAFSELLRRLKK